MKCKDTATIRMFIGPLAFKKKKKNASTIISNHISPNTGVMVILAMTITEHFDKVSKAKKKNEQTKKTH